MSSVSLMGKSDQEHSVEVSSWVFTHRKRMLSILLRLSMPLIKLVRSMSIDVPLVIEIQAFFKKPKLTKKEQALNLPKHKFPTKKPDGDNIAKAILDSLNAVAYHDDSYVTELSVSKYYTDGEERVNVVIYEKQ
jgi:Holliday junction resolvase RusA-like endonuclease